WRRPAGAEAGGKFRYSAAHLRRKSQGAYVGSGKANRIGKRLLAAALLLVSVTAAAQGEAEGNPADPWEGINRRIFIFNDYADRWLLRPVAQGYQRITPDPLERGITNVFNNLGEISNLVNNLLQGKVKAGASDGGRFLIN